MRVTHPDKLYYSKQTQLSKARIVRYYLSIAPASSRRNSGSSAGAEAVREWGRAGGVLPEARADGPASLVTNGHARRSRLAAPLKSWLWMMRLGLPGSLTWAASSYTRTRCARAIWNIQTSCGSISIPVQG